MKKELCERACVFRNSTVQLLRSIGPKAPEYEKLGNLLRKSLIEKESKMFPLFHFGLYYSDVTQREIVRYEPESFFDGMNVRVNVLLNHIESCIHKHGENIVIRE